MSTCKCAGWWQQDGLGRQPMDELWLNIERNSIRGSGFDIVAPFMLTGNIRPDGGLEMIKKYEGKHTVLYVGRYDGEGTFFGTWDICGHQGKWLIRYVRPDAGDSEIQELLPPQN